MVSAIRGLLSLLGRLMIVTIFLMSTLGNKIPHFSDVAAYMKVNNVPVPEILLTGAIVFLIVGSVSVLVGYKARLGAFLLLVFLVGATYYFHNFWDKTDLKEQQAQMIQFMKNLSMMGAMFFIMANGAGAWSLDACWTDTTG